MEFLDIWERRGHLPTGLIVERKFEGNWNWDEFVSLFTLPDGECRKWKAVREVSCEDVFTVWPLLGGRLLNVAIAHYTGNILVSVLTLEYSKSSQILDCFALFLEAPTSVWTRTVFSQEEINAIASCIEQTRGENWEESESDMLTEWARYDRGLSDREVLAG